jgi:hypothetical protein
VPFLISLANQRARYTNRRAGLAGMITTLVSNQFFLFAVLFLGFGRFLERLICSGDSGRALDAFAFYQFFHRAKLDARVSIHEWGKESIFPFFPTMRGCGQPVQSGKTKGPLP